MSIDEKIKSILAGMPKDKAEDQIDKSLNIWFAIEAIATIGLYLLIRSFVPPVYADTGLICLYLLQLKENIDLVSYRIKSAISNDSYVSHDTEKNNNNESNNTENIDKDKS